MFSKRICCSHVVGIILVCFLSTVECSVKSTTIGVPACYISRSYWQDVSGLSERCGYSSLSYPAYNSDSADYYMFCSWEHECCTNDGYYRACCSSNGDPDFTEGQIVGLVAGCMVFVTIILGVAMYASKRLCEQDESD